MDTQNRYSSGQQSHNKQSSGTQQNYHNYLLSSNISSQHIQYQQQRTAIKSNDFSQNGQHISGTAGNQSSHFISSDPAKRSQAYHEASNTQVGQQYRIGHEGQFHQQQPEADRGQQTKHKPQFSQMSVESPKFAINNQQQQHSQQQLLQHTNQQHQRRQVGQASNTHATFQQDGSMQNNQLQGKSHQLHHSDNTQSNQANRQQRQNLQEIDQQHDQQKKQNGTSHHQSYSQSRYVSQKNEKDIKQITKVDLRKLNQLDNTIEEEDLEQQLRAAQIASNAQSRSQSYAAATRGQEELKVKESEQTSDADNESEMERKMATANKRNIPSSTYHQISGEELRYELFFAPRNNSKSSHNEYFGYKEMVQMYQAEIKRRWDQRAQIKERYVFPRISTKKQNLNQNAQNPHQEQSQLLNQNTNIQSHRRIQSKTPILMAQLDPKVTQESQTPLMDSKGPSQNISLIPSEGKISPTKQRPKQNGGQQMLAKSMTSKDATLFKSSQQQQTTQTIGQQSINSAKHQKNAMSGENPKKSIRGSKAIEHSHTQSAAVVSLVKNSQDLSKMNMNQTELPQKMNEGKQQNMYVQQNVIPESKRERRNQQQIQNMMKYNQHQQQQDQIVKQQQVLHGQSNATQKAIKPQQFQQQSTYHLSRNGNLSDLQKPQIMSMQPQHRARVESQLMSYGGQIGQQLQHGTSQKQMQTVQNSNMKNHQGRSATQMQQHHPRQANQSYLGQSSAHQQKQSIDSLKRLNQNNYIRHDSQKNAQKKAINQHYTQYNKSFINKQYEVGSSSQGKGTQSNTRNAASIISFKSSKSPALNRPNNNKIVDSTGNGNISTSSKQQERTMTQQQIQVIGAMGEQISQRQTTRSQIKSDQIPGSFTKFKQKASVNKNSIISLNKYSINEQRSSQNEEAVNDHNGIQIGQTSTRAAQRKNLQYQNYKAQIEQGSLISQGGVSNRKGVSQGQSHENIQVQNTFQSYINDQTKKQQQVTRMVSNNTQIKKQNDNGSSLVATIEKSEEVQKPNNSVSPVKQKPFKQLYHQQPQHLQQSSQVVDHTNGQSQIGNIRSTMTVQKASNINAIDQSSPKPNKINGQKAQVSIFDTSPDSLNFENSKKKQQDLMARDNQHNFIAAYDESQINNPTLMKVVGQDQYRTQNTIDQMSQKHANSQSSDIMRYQSQQQQNSAQSRHYIINNAVMTHQLEFNNGRTVNQPIQGQKEMSVVLEAQRESLENLIESRESVQAEGLNSNISNQQLKKQMEYKATNLMKQPSSSENVAPDLSHESINMIPQPITVTEMHQEQNRVSMSGSYDRGSKKVLYTAGQSNQKTMKKDGSSKVIQKSMMTHHQTRSMQSIEQRPQSSKSHLRSDKHRNQITHQQHQSQMFNEYNDTIESINQIKNQRQRSSGINNSSSSFQNDQHQKLHSQSSQKHSKTFGKSSSKQVIANQQHAHALLANINNGLTTSAPQANRLIQKQIVGQNFTINQMIGSRNVSQGLKNINSMKEQRIVGVSQDQIHPTNPNLSTLQAHHQTQSTITIQPSDMILGIQKQQQMVGKMGIKSQAQRQQSNNQNSMSIFKPANIIQQNKQNHQSQSASRNNQLMPQNPSSSMLYGGSQNSHQGQGSGSYIASDSINNQAQLTQPGQSNSNHQHFHSLSSQQEFLQNNSNSQFRRQVIRDGQQQNMSGAATQQAHLGNHKQPGGQGSLITLNMAVGNYPVNTRQVTDSNSYYGGVASTSGQPVQSSYSIQIQPKIPKKKRQTNSYSGAVGQNVVTSSQGAMNMNKMNQGHIGGLSGSYGEGGASGIITTQGISMNSLGQQQQYHNQYQQMVHTSTKTSGNAKHRGKNTSSSVNSQNSMKHNYQQPLAQSVQQHQSNYPSNSYHHGHAIVASQQQLQGPTTSKQVHLGPGGSSLSHQTKSKSSTIYQQMQASQQPMSQQQPGPTGPISQMGILRNAQMKPKK